MMKSRPLLRMYAAVAASTGALRSSARSGLATDGPAHRVSDDDVAVRQRLLKRLHRHVGADFSKCHRGARAKLAVFSSAQYPARVQNVRQQLHAVVTAQRAVGIEERHLLSESAVAQLTRFQMSLDAAQRCAVVAGAEHFHSRDPDVAVVIGKCALEYLQCAG